MDALRSELAYRKELIYSRLYARAIVIKIICFIILFSALFWIIRLNNLLPEYKLEEDIRSIPTLFAAGNFLYSIFNGFIVQTQWTKWDRLINANRGEITMLRQLFILAHHFPYKEMIELRYRVYRYLDTYINVSEDKSPAVQRTRSKKVDEELIKIDDTMYKLLKAHPSIGSTLAAYLTRAMEFREEKLLLSSQRLPHGIKMFVYFSTFSVIFGSLFVPFNNIIFNYYFALVVALMAFAVYLIIEDFDDPFRPGNFTLTAGLYRNLRSEIKSKLQKRGFDVEQKQSINP